MTTTRKPLLSPGELERLPLGPVVGRPTGTRRLLLRLARIRARASAILRQPFTQALIGSMLAMAAIDAHRWVADEVAAPFVAHLDLMTVTGPTYLAMHRPLDLLVDFALLALAGMLGRTVRPLAGAFDWLAFFLALDFGFDLIEVWLR